MRDLPRIEHAIYREPWCITPGGHASVRSVYESAIRAGIADMMKSAGNGDPVKAQVIGEVGLITIAGTIVRIASPLERTCGAISCEDISDQIHDARAGGAKTFLFNFDSPGGGIQGVSETALSIATMPEKTYAFSAGQMCSAAFWMACGCDTVLATPTASVGSIGVVCSILDQSAAYAARGESVNVFQSGDLKSTGIPGKPLTAEQCAHLQAQVDEIFGMFKSHVQTNRPGVKAEAFRGQSVFGAQAKALGLVDHIVSSFENAVAIAGG